MTESQSKPKSFEVTLYRSGFDDIEIVLAAKDSAQACQKAIKAYGSWNVVRTREIEPVKRYPHESGDHIIIGPECFSDRAGQNIMWKGQHFRATPDQPETLSMIQAAAAKYMFIALGNLPKKAEDVLIEQLTRAFNAGYEAHTADMQNQPTFCHRCDIKVDQEGYERWASEVVATEPEIGMAEESEEDKRFRLQRRADQADLIDWILNYRNPADGEARMRQIRVVMD